MKSVQEILGGREKMAKMVFEKWDKITGCWEYDGSKYGHWNDEQLTYNDILGYVKVKKVKEAELSGAIVWQYGAWKIASEIKLNEKGEPRLCASDRWYKLKNEMWPPKREIAPLPEEMSNL